jgi:hypothetical protein
MTIRAAQRGARGGKRSGAGGPRGPKPQTIANAAAVQASRELTAAVVLEQMRRGTCFDARRLFTAEGVYIPFHLLSEEDAAMVAGFEFVSGNLDKGDGKLDRIVKVRLIDRARYVELAARHHGMLVDRVKLEDDKPLRDKVATARKRLAAARAAKVKE